MPYREMRPRILTALLSALAAIAVALVASGCGSSSATLDPLASAAEVTSQAGGAHMSLTAHIEASSFPSPVTMTGEGFFNYKSHEGKLAATLTGLPANAVTGPSVSLEELFKASDVYIGSSLFAGKLPGGAHWMKLDIARVGQAAGLSPSALLGGQSNPAQFLEYLKASGGSVHAVGQEPVRGVATTHYRGTIDLHKALGVLGSSSSGALHAAIEKSIAQIGVSTLPVDVWTDAHHLVRRFGLALDMSPAGQHVKFTLDVELFDFGATPSVSAPASSETYDATATALSGLKALGG